MSPHATLWEYLALFLLLFSLSFLNWNPTLQNRGALARYAVSDALFRYGQWDIEAVQWVGEGDGVYGPDGRLYSRYPPAVSLLALPLVALGFILPDVGPVQMAPLLPLLLHALAGLYLYALGRRLFPTRPRGAVLGVTLLWTLGSLVLPPARHFSNEAVSVCALLAAAHALHRFQSKGQWGVAWQGSLWLALALLASWLNLLALPFFVRGLFRTLRPPYSDWLLRRLFALALPLLAAVAFLLWYQWQRWGTPFHLGDEGDAMTILFVLLPFLCLRLVPWVARTRWELLMGGLAIFGLALALWQAAGGLGPIPAWIGGGAAGQRLFALQLGIVLAGVGAGSWAWRYRAGSLLLMAGFMLAMVGIWLLLGDQHALRHATLHVAMETLPSPLPPGAQLWYDGPSVAEPLLNQLKGSVPLVGFHVAGATLPPAQLSRTRARVEAAQAPIFLLSDGPARIANGLDTLLAQQLFFVTEQQVGPYRVAHYWQGALSQPYRLANNLLLTDGQSLQIREVRATPRVPVGGVLAVEVRAVLSGTLTAPYQWRIQLQDNSTGEQVVARWGGLMAPGEAMQGGHVLVERQAIALPPSLPAGRYILRLALHPAQGGRPPADDGGLAVHTFTIQLVDP